MNIVFFTLSMQIGGAERVISNLANYYVLNGNEVTIVTCLNRKDEYQLDFRIHRKKLDVFSHQRNELKFIRFVRRRHELKKYLKENKVDIMVCFLPEPSLIALSLKTKFYLPIIISERMNPYEEFKFYPYQLIMKLLYPRTDGFVWQTEDAKRYFKGIVDCEGKIIPNPINNDFLENSVNIRRSNKIISVGRLEASKNHKMLIYAFAQVLKRFPNYKLEIYGEGVMRKELECLILKMGLKNKILLAGKTKNIKKCMETAKIFVLPSDSEGMPNALMEAMALGLPVIATDCPCGGVKSLVENKKNGLLIQVGSVKELVDSIILLLENPCIAEKLGIEAKKICKELNPNRIYEQWCNYIDGILEEKNVKRKVNK